MNLHSNLVIFKYLSIISWHFVLGQFTFQSGDIQIKLSAIGDTVVIYLHSNLVIFKFAGMQRETEIITLFTFQSGDIQIHFYILLKFFLHLFTFQSGDIQMLKS